jgi:hypothetical protein
VRACQLGTGTRRFVKGAKLLKWVRENAGWAQIAVAWLVAVTIGIVIYFFPIARLLDSLGQ